MTITIARWTLADYHRLVEMGLFQDRRVELLNGLIVEMSPESPDHADSSTQLMPKLWSAAKGRYQVRAAKPICIPESDSQPEPDIALVRDISYRQAHPTPTDVFLIIEFSNRSLAKDTDEKREVYAQAGIQEYWVVNLRDRHLIVYRQPMDGDYQSRQIITSGEVAPLLFPDVVINISQLVE